MSRIQLLSEPLRLLITDFLPTRDISSVARLSRMFRYGWSQRSLTFDGKTSSEQLRAATIALGSRVERVNRLYFGSAKTRTARDIGVKDLIAFRGVCKLGAIGLGGSSFQEILTRAVFPRLHGIDVGKADAGWFRDILDYCPSAVTEQITSLSICPYDMSALSTNDLSSSLVHLERLAIELDDANFDAGALALAIQSFPTLRSLTLDERRVSHFGSFGDVWTAEAFSGTCSRLLTDIQLITDVPLCLTPVGLQAIAKHCPAMVRFSAGTILRDVGSSAWNDMIPVFRDWSATLEELTLPVLSPHEATAEFFQQTTELCLGLSLLAITVAAARANLSDNVVAAMSVWTKRHHRLNQRGGFLK